MDDNPISTEKIRAYVDKHLNRAKFTQRIMLWVLHLFVFLFFFLGAAPLVVVDWLLAVGWIIGLLIHAAAIWMESAAGERYLRSVLAQRAIKDLYIEAATSAALSEPEKEKAKRDQIVALSDDGELVPIDEDEHEADTRTMRRAGPG